MSYKILSTAPQDVLKIEAVKNYLRISHDYDDLWLKDLIDAAIDSAENFLRIKLLSSICEMKFSKINYGVVKLYGHPIAKIIEVYGRDRSGVDHQLLHHSFKDDELQFECGGGFNDLTDKYMVGYINQQDIPAAIGGIMLHVAEMYDNHGSIILMSSEVQKLYQPYRKMSI
jgi:uncharacterized phiE125 gp8 family phage protein